MDVSANSILPNGDVPHSRRVFGGNRNVRRPPRPPCGFGLASPRALSPTRVDYLLGGGHAGEIGAVRSGIVMLRTRLAGEEQAIVHRGGQCASALRLTGQSIGIRAAGERVAAPAMKPERFHPAGEIAAEQPD